MMVTTSFRYLVLILFSALLSFDSGLHAQEVTQTPITEKHLKAAANNSLWRLKRAVEKDGYYSARVALNVWRSNAIDAGTFDQDQYDEFKKRIYEKSIQNNLQCYERSIQKSNVTDARICLFTWREHAQELDVFDPDRYEDMQKKLKEAARDKK